MNSHSCEKSISKVIYDDLARFDSAHQLSEFLLDQNVKSNRNGYRNPLFTYLNNFYAKQGAFVVEVDSGEIGECGTAHFVDDILEENFSIRLPIHASVFVRNFYSGHYPELESYV